MVLASFDETGEKVKAELQKWGFGILTEIDVKATLKKKLRVDFENEKKGGEKMKKYDLIIVGGGAAGFAAAMKANELGAKSLMINNDTIGIGGTCVNVGCVPTKHLLHIGGLIRKMWNNNFPGLKISLSVSFRTIIDEKNKLIEKLRNEKYRNVLESLDNVELVEGNAKFVAQNEVMVNGEIYGGDKFIIATGSSAFIPPIEGIEKVDFLTNIEALQLKELPESMIVLGGGPLGIEFAQIFSRFGTRVCLLQRSKRILKREEPELAALLLKYLEDEGVEICTGVVIKSIVQKNGKKIVEATVDEKERTYEAEQLLIATGRIPNTKNLGLEKVGVKLGKRGEVIVNEVMQSSENIWAAGDVTGEPMLETVAAKEGMVAANNALSKNQRRMDYRIVPHAVFTDPQLAGVGLTDEQAIERGINCRCNTVPMELVPKAQAIRDPRGAIKMVIDNRTQEIIGLHILAPEAADLIHEGVMIVKNRMKVDDVIDTLHIFPTLSEGIKLSAQSFRRDITKMSCCVE